MDNKPDFESTSAFMKRKAPGVAWLPKALQEYMTPTAVAAVAIAAITAISSMVKIYHDLETTEKELTQAQITIGALNKEREESHTDIRVLTSQVNELSDRVDKIESWKDRIEGIADSPPHARRHK